MLVTMKYETSWPMDFKFLLCVARDKWHDFKCQFSKIKFITNMMVY
jgi:hypothetical protein